MASQGKQEPLLWDQPWIGPAAKQGFVGGEVFFGVGGVFSEGQGSIFGGVWECFLRGWGSVCRGWGQFHGGWESFLRIGGSATLC
jgi:hypothetical protein